MSKFCMGIVVGIVISTIGVSGIVNILDNSVRNLQKITIENYVPPAPVLPKQSTYYE